MKLYLRGTEHGLKAAKWQFISFQEVYRFYPKLVDEFDSDPKVASFFVKRLFDWRKIDRFLGYMPND